MPYNRHLAAKQQKLAFRARIIQAVRDYFIAGGYLETETPLRIPAPAPETHIDAVASGTWFLQTSPELCMKRLIAAGYPKLFQICRCWRDGERGSLHLPEFTMLEWYRANADYRDLMSDCEGLVRTSAAALGKEEHLFFRNRRIRLDGAWERLTVREAFNRYGGMSMETSLEQDCFDEVMVERIEPNLGLDRPVFLLDYPANRSALARLKANDPSVAERFELYLGGIELANAFSELTDATEQRERFLRETAERADLGRQPYPLPEKFLAELAHLPPTAGIALGLDRLVMVLLDAATIDDVVAFTPEDL